MSIFVPLYGELLQCPYERSHLIRPERMQVHLIKCERQHPHIKLEKCLFNYTHHIKPEEYQEHLRTCNDRILVESCLYTTEGEAAKPPPVQPPVEEYTPEQLAAGWGEENWDDMNEKPYDPAKYCRENKIIQKARLMTKSERREFYRQETIRHDMLAKKEMAEKEAMEMAEKQAKEEAMALPKKQTKKRSPKKKN